MTTKPSKPGTGADDASSLIDARIAELGDWRGETLAQVRRVIHQADPAVTETWKWRGVPVWEHAGILCTGETYKDKVKLTFAKGASLPDPSGLFNSSLDGNARRAIDFLAGDKVNEKALKALIRAAIDLNTSMKKPAKAKPGKPALLTGGNPQIAKSDGDAPVQAYIAAMPGWKSDLGKRIDALIVETVPGVQKAVKWNSPFYGMPGQGWFLSFHVFTRYVKVTFFAGRSLRPMPPGHTEKSGEARWIDIHEGDTLDEPQFAAWARQAAKLPGFLSK